MVFFSGVVVRLMSLVNRWWRFGLPIVAGVSLLSAALADFLFYDEVIGWTLGGFVAWLLLLMLARNGRAALFGPRWALGWALVLLALGLCVSLVLEPGTIAIVLSLIMLSTLAMVSRDARRGRVFGWGWLARLVTAWVMVWFRPIIDCRLANRWQRRAVAMTTRAMAVLKLFWGVLGIVIPLVLSLIFIGLFALANPVVQQWMGNGWDHVADFFANLSERVTYTRLFIWYLAGILCWGLLRYRSDMGRLRRRWYGRLRPGQAHNCTYGEDHPVHQFAEHKREDVEAASYGDALAVKPIEQKPSKTSEMKVWLSGRVQSLIVRCLIAMNVVFAVQLVLDSRYLVLGSELPEGMSYAEYAQRGAYPLIATAILAAALVLAVFRPGGIAQRSKLAVWLVLIWIVQNIVLVASAAWRLQAYVEVFTLTRLRVAAGVWMLMVAGCLALLLWRIARSRDNTWLTAWAMGWGIAVLWVCSFVPFDPLIAGYNVRHCKEMGGEAGAIDLAYLESLGPDALPAIVYLTTNMPEEVANRPSRYGQEVPSSRSRIQPELVWYEREGRELIQAGESQPRVYSLGDELADLRAHLTEQLDEQLDGWRGWTVRRAWLERSIAE